MSQISAALDLFLAHRRRLAEALDAVRRLLDEAQRLQLMTEGSVEKIEKTMLEIEQLVRLRREESQCERQLQGCGLLVVGQTKAGKSTFINELLGEQVVTQSQNPCTSRVTRITYSAESFSDDSQDVKVIGRPSEFLLASGLDLVDTPGLNESAHLDQLTLSAIDAFLPLVVYIVNANNGVSHIVEEDIRSLQARLGGPDKIFYLATHMDVDEADAAGCARTRAIYQQEKLYRLLVGLQRFGCFGPCEQPQVQLDGRSKQLNETEWQKELLDQKSNARSDQRLNGSQRMRPSASLNLPQLHNFCCVSSRVLTTVRHRRRRQKLRQQELTPVSEEEAQWLEAFQRAKSSLASFAARRLTELPSEATSSMRCSLLDDLHNNLAELASPTVEEACLTRRLALLDIGHAAARLLTDSSAAASVVSVRRDLIQWLTAALRRNYRELTKEEYSEPQTGHKLLEVLACQVGREFDVGMPCLAGFLQRGVSLVKQFEAVALDSLQQPQRQALRSAATYGFRLAERSLLRQLSDQKALSNDGGKQSNGAASSRLRFRFLWGQQKKLSVEEDFICTLNPTRLADGILQDLRIWFEERHQRFMEAVHAVEDWLRSELRAATEKRRLSLALQPRCLTLSLQLDSIVTECGQLHDCFVESERWQLVAVGTQGSRLYRHGDKAIKELMLSERQLGEIAPGLHASRDTSSTYLVDLTGLRLENIISPTDEPPGMWRLELVMPFLSGCCDLPAFLTHRRPSLLERLRVAMATAEAVSWLHSERKMAHGNLRPSNVFVIMSGDKLVVKLSDLGQRLSAADRDGSPEQTSTLSSSPCQRLFSQMASRDICSLGSILKFLIASTADEAVSTTFYLEASASLPPEFNSEISRLLIECQPDALAPPGFADSSCGLSAAVVTARLRALLSGASVTLVNCKQHD